MNDMKNMHLIVKIQCGLGNQMFQYAFGKVLSKKTGVDVLFDINDYIASEKTIVGNTGRNKDGMIVSRYGLDIFNLDIKYATREQAEKCINLKRKRNTYLPGCLRKMFKINKWNETSNKIAESMYCDYTDEYFYPKKDAYYVGYFQNEKYFAGYEDEIRSYFRFPEFAADDTFNCNWLDKIKQAENSVMIHIRRGDYLQLGWQITEDYYKNAVKLIQEKVSNPKFFVFGCETEDYVKNVFDIGVDYSYIGETNHNNNQDWKDLKLMSECRHAIIANSSFSWWAAYLKSDKDKIVVAPTPWLLGRDDTVCASWYKISA